jgi:hypothetical protein
VCDGGTCFAPPPTALTSLLLRFSFVQISLHSPQTKRAGSSAYSSAKQFDEQHNVSGKTKAAASDLAKRASDFNNKHNVTGKTANGLKSGMDFISKRLSSASSASTK